MSVLLSVATGACGSEGQAEAEEAPDAGEGAPGQLVGNVTETGRVYSLEDLLSIGFKKARTYDVEGLPEATSAYFGYWGLDPYNRLDYEARFYESHEDAVQYGPGLAEERVGADAKLKMETATWTGGLGDATQCKALGGVQEHRSCVEPKYFGYVMYGNMVLLCQGLDEKESLGRCAALTGQIE